MLQEIANLLLPPTVKGKVIEVKKREAGLDYCIYLPQNYDEKRKYPILYHLHGTGELFYTMKLQVLWTAVQLEKAQVDMIVVAPHDPTYSSMWMDGYIVNMTRLFHDEFLTYIESSYSVKRDRSTRYLQGFSMGGLGAALHGFKYQDTFGKVLIWDGTLDDWDSLLQHQDFMAQWHFRMDAEKFDLDSPWAAIRAAAEVGTIHQTPVLLYTGRCRHTSQTGSKFKNAVLNQGGVITHKETKLAHDLKTFLRFYGQEAIEFLIR
jgi:Putative esterase